LDSQTAAAFRAIPYGVYLLTARQGTLLHTVIVSWVSQVSFSPPRLMVALRYNRRAIPAIRESQAFSLSLLSRDQKAHPQGLPGRLEMPPLFYCGSRGPYPFPG
jgi:flavin reductase (DIM6/NTAB) family NADH-FMN oxidoreductase RutF